MDATSLDEFHEVRCNACLLLVEVLKQLNQLNCEKSDLHHGNHGNHQGGARPTTLSIATGHNNDLPKFAAYLSSILDKHKVNSTILQSLSATVRAMVCLFVKKYCFYNSMILLTLFANITEIVCLDIYVV